MLAARPDFYSRDQLQEMFWPDLPADDSRRRLREELSRLRSELPDPGLLTTTADTAGLAGANLSVDVREYQALRNSIGSLPWRIPDNLPLPLDLLTKVTRSVALWHGASFLEGVRLPATPALDEWLLSTDQGLKAWQLRLLRRLAWHRAATGEMAAAVKTLEQAFLLDDLNEEITAQILRWYLDLGQRERALDFYRQFRDHLEVELGTSPGPELQDLSRRLVSTEGNAASNLNSPLSLRPTLMLPYVGRREHLQRLEAALQAGGGVLIRGASGAGKTRLIHEFASRHVDTYRLIVLRCRLSDSAVPLQPLAQGLREGVEPGEWRQLDRAWLDILSHWLPELQTYVQLDGAPIELYSQYARQRLQEAVRQLFLLLAESNPVLLIVDDVQWADEATINTLAYLLEHAPFENHSLILLSWRDEVPNPHLAAWLPQLQDHSKFQQVKLEGLAVEDIARICWNIFHQETSPQFIVPLMHATSGNPFFVLESLRSMLEQGLTPEDSPARIPMPDSVRELLMARLRLVSMNASRLLASAAVLGTVFELPHARLVAEISPLHAAQAVEELEQRALIETRPDSPGWLVFTHDRIRETILESMHPMRRKMLNQKTFELLQDHYRPDPDPHAALLAELATGAGLIDQAFDYWVLAAQHALHLFSPEEAERSFQRAEDLLEQHREDMDRDQIYHLYALWSNLAFDLNKADQVTHLNNRLLEIGRERSDQLLMGTALDGLSDAAMATNQFEQGLEYAEQAAGHLKSAGDAFELTEAVIHEGVFLYMLNRLPESLQKLKEAQNYAPKISDPRILRFQSLIHYHQAVVYCLIGQASRGFFEALLAKEVSSRSRDPYNQVNALSMLAFSGFFTGQYARAIEYADQGLELADKLRSRRMLGYLTGYRSMNQLALGNIRQAQKDALQAQELGHQTGHYEITAFGCRLEGDLSGLVGDWTKAQSAYAAGVEMGKTGFWALDNLFRLGVVTAKSGEFETGLSLIIEAVEQARQAGLLMVEILARALLADTYLDAKNYAAADQHARWVIETCQQVCVPAVSQGAKSILSFCLAQRGQLDQAREYARQAYEEAARLGDRWILISAIRHQLQLADELGFTLLDEQVLRRRKKSLRQELLAQAPDETFTSAINQLLS